MLLPSGFQVTVVADGIGRARHLAVRDNGDIYVAMRESSSGKCLAGLRDEDGDGIADLIHYFGDFGECGSVKIKGDYLYFSNLDTVYRAALGERGLPTIGPAEVVATGFGKNGPWHNYKIIAFDDSDNLYVNVGAPSNACQEQWRTPGSPGLRPCPHLSQHAGIWKFHAQRLGQLQEREGERYATGIRNAVALSWNPVAGSLYAIPHGRDLLHQLWPEHYSQDEAVELPAEEFFKLREGFNGGWPYTYYDPQKQARMQAPEYGGTGVKPPIDRGYDDPVMTFPAHWAPNDLVFYTDDEFPQAYYGGAFVAFVGGWNRAPQAQGGYKVAFVPFDVEGLPSAAASTFIDGFAGTTPIRGPDDARYRPTGLAQGPDGSLFVADSVQGRIWRITYTGKPGDNKPESRAGGKPTPAVSDGSALGQNAAADDYLTHCASCHMSGGGGVPNFSPALANSESVNGPPAPLIALVQQGRPASKYANAMPGFRGLGADTIARILTYVRGNFGNNAGPVSAEMITQAESTADDK
ncbi:MAG: PQQ-dependent sugar dehydrogenase [Pseudomonadales bacterium]